MRITLNLATRPYADLGPVVKRLRIGLVVLAAICIALGIGLHLVHNKAEEARAREHSLDGQLAKVNKERQSYMALMQQPDNAALLQQAAALNQIIDEKSFSWTLAMENLETVLPGGVQVTTLEPIRDKDGRITLHLRVVGPQNLSVELVENLEHSKRFLQPRIVGETAEEANNGANQKLEPVSATNRFDFDLQAEYNPPTPEERKAAKSESKKQDEKGEEAAPASARPASRVQRLPRHPARPEPAKPNPARTAQPQGGVR